MGRTADHHLAEAIYDVAQNFLGEVDDHAARHAASIHAAIDEFGQGAAVTAQTREAVRSTLVAFALYVCRPELAPPVQVPGEAASYARAFVARRFPLRALLRIYLLGQAELWRTWQASVRAAGLGAGTEEAVLERTHEQMMRFTERLTVSVVDVYEAERAKRRRDIAAVRADCVRDVLENSETQLGEAEATLRYGLTQHHLGFVIWTADAEGPSRPLHDDVWCLIAETSDASALAVCAGRNVLWGWLGGSASRLRSVIDRLDGWRIPHEGVSVAVGEPAPGVAGFRASHRQAVEVRRVLEAGGRDTPVCRRFQDLAIPALATMDPAMATGFVKQCLGDLASDDDTSARLRATLAVYFEEGESPSATAKRLGVHVNTVTYRLRQIEEVLGRPPTEPRLETQLALRLAPFMNAVR